MPLGEYLEIIKVDNEKLVRCRCGYQFGLASQNWKENAIKITPFTEITGPFVKFHDDLEARQYICPECGLSLCVEVARKGDPSLFEAEFKT
jgi:acetone carboxylase gamma subunit